MPSLPETQQLFAAALTGDAASVSALCVRLAGSDAAGRRRFEAYRRNVSGNWVNALRATYPVIERLVGSVFFAEAARQYSHRVASRSGDLNDYGESFAEFIADYPHARHLPYLADMARLEWSVQASYYAADCEAFDFASLAGIPAEQHGGLSFSLAPAFARRLSDFPLAAIWQAHQGDEVAGVELAAGPHAAWVVRPRGGVGVEPVSIADDAFAAALAQGISLEAAIGRGLAVDGDFNAGDCLRRMVGWGVLAGLATAGEYS